MDEYVVEQNHKYIDDWIKKNPNFYDLKLENNTLISSDGEKIDLNNFLVSTLLTNPLVINTITVMSEKTFIRILKLNAKAFKISNTTNKALINNAKINNVKINDKGLAVAETDSKNDDEKNVEITGHKALEVLSTYNTLIADNTVHIPLSTLLRSLSVDKFYDLIEKNYELSKEDYKYINIYSDFMFDLMYDKSFLIKEASDILDKYEFTMNSLQAKEDKTPNETAVLNIYLDKQREFDLKLIEKEKEELSRKNKSSRGYSLLALIVTSVVVTAMLLILLIVTK